jgi:hypothetical protein
MLNLAGTVKPKGGAVALAALDSKILVIFKMMGIIELFQFFPTYKDALRDLDAKLAAELADVGPALKLEEPPPLVAAPRAAVKTASRVETSRRPMPRIAPPPVNPIVQFFRSLFGLDEVSPAFFRRSSRKRR